MVTCGVTDRLERFSKGLEAGQKRCFGSLGVHVARCPYITVMVCVLVAAALACGTLLLDTHPSGFDIWVPVGSRAIGEDSYVSSTFGTFRTSFIIAVARNNSNNSNNSNTVLTRAALSELLHFQQRVINETFYVSSGVCARVAPLAPCFPVSILNVWNNDADELSRDDDVLQTINEARPLSLTDVLAPNLTSILGNGGLLAALQTLQALQDEGGAAVATALLPENITDLLGGFTLDGNGQVISARAIVMVFPENTLKLAYGHGDTSGDLDPELTAWEDAFSEMVENAVLQHSRLFVRTRHSAPVEGSKAVQGDLKFFGGAATLMTLYVLFSLTTRWSWSTTHVALGLGAIFSVLLSTGAAFGLCGLLGVKYSDLVVAVPFLILGVGIDDAFVLVGALDRSDSSKDVPSRIKFMMSEAGPSILMTSVTDMLAFYVSSFTPLPALSGFCLFACAAVFCDWLLQVTLFVAFAVLDLRRQNAGRLDVFCCYRRYKLEPLGDEQQSVGAASDAELLVEDDDDDDDNGILEDTRQAHADSSQSETRMTRFCLSYSNILQFKVVKGAVVVLWLALFIMGIWGAAHLSSGLSQTDLFRDDSALVDFYEQKTKYFSHRDQVPLDIILPAQDFFNKTVQLQILQLQNAVFSSKWVVPGPPSWIENFVAFTENKAMDEDEFYKQLFAFLAQNSRHLSDIVFQGAFIKATRIRTKGHVVINSDLTRSAAMTEVRNLCASFEGVTSFPFSYRYPFWEQYSNFIGRNLASFTAVLFAILLTLIILLGHLGTSLMIVFLIVSVDVCMLGVMFITGTQVSNVSVVLLLVSLGLAVDSIAHVAHSYHFSPGKTEERTATALTQIGASVLKGAFTSALGVVLLGFAQHGIMRLFFKFFMSMFVLSVFHGLAVLPVIFSLISDLARCRRSSADSLQLAELEEI